MTNREKANLADDETFNPYEIDEQSEQDWEEEMYNDSESERGIY